MRTPEKNITLKRRIIDANDFIISIFKLLEMDTDGLGFDGLNYSIDDCKDALNKIKEETWDEAIKDAAKSAEEMLRLLK